MESSEQIQQIIEASQRVLIIQADNPDADSLASALALEDILHKMGKEPILYCGVDMPEYLRYLSGWDRVSREVPHQFDASIIVDTSAISLLEQLQNSGAQGWVASKPVIILDHHAEVACDIPFANVVINDASKVATGELIYELAKQLGWPLSVETNEYIMTSILADSLGLATENTSPQTYRVMAELIESGVSRPKLEELRRAFSKMPEKIFRYKADLIERTEFYIENKLAMVIIPHEEITEYSPLFNPNALIQNEHLQTKDVVISVSIKAYQNGRITAAIRCNNAAPIADKLAAHFGGGGHKYAAGFKLEDGKTEDIKKELIIITQELLHEAV